RASREKIAGVPKTMDQLLTQRVMQAYPKAGPDQIADFVKQYKQKAQVGGWKPTGTYDDNGMPYFYRQNPDTGEPEMRLGTVGGTTAAPTKTELQQTPQAKTRVASLAEQGIIGIHNDLLKSGALDYSKPDNVPLIERGMEVPEPKAIAGKTAQAL